MDSDCEEPIALQNCNDVSGVLAGGTEGHGPVLAHLAGDAVRAGDGAAVLVHDEVIDGEAAGRSGPGLMMVSCPPSR